MNIPQLIFKKSRPLLPILLVLLLVVNLASATQTRYNYGEALQKSILFYEAQQAGKLPAWNRVPWRADAALQDGSDVGVDLTGGWFDAGDHVKFGFPMAATVTLLAWGGIEYYAALAQAGELVHLTQNLKWATDYFLKAFANDTPGNYVLYGQVGDGKQDHNWWGAAEVVHYQMPRPAYKIDTSCPGSDLAAETASALAAASILFRQMADITYSDLLIAKAEKLYDFAEGYRGNYSDCLSAAAEFYQSYSGYQDELVWGAIWLHKAKKAQNSAYDGTYLNKAIAEYQLMSKPYNYTVVYDDKSYGVYVLLAQETGEREYQQRAEAWLDYWTIGYQGERVTYTPGGLAYLAKWASLTLASTTAFVGFIYSDWLREQGKIATAERYWNFGVAQINYILGNNPANRSYLVGFGQNSPLNPHHRTAHGSWLNNGTIPADNRNLLVGALVGGPDEQDRWQDNRLDWVQNEVAIGYNAALVGALARMYQEFGGTPLADLAIAKNETDAAEIYLETTVLNQTPSLIEISTKIINKSATPARGLEQPIIKLVFQGSLASANDVSVAVNSSDCPKVTASDVQLQNNSYSLDVSCTGTVIYPGGESHYQKQLQIRLEKLKPNYWERLFSRPIKVKEIHLFEGEALISSQSFD
ncbi:MAG TPA: glycoside hydrolase family 9 protein [Xenococcaceae cyanobacterium]